MSVEIPNGAIATYQGTWGHGTLGSLGGLLLGTINPESDVAAVQKELINDGLTITGHSVSGGLSAAFGGSYDITLTILNQSGQELDDIDLVAQVNDALAVNGLLQNAGGIVGVTTGSAGGTGSSQTVTTAVGAANQAAAAAAASATKTHACGDPSWSFFDDPGQWFSCLASKGLSTLGLVFIGLLVGVVLIVAAEKRPV